ncbi:recombinase family protein [Desulfobacter postgatei]|jgi:DNA invertase Pin-like site-specific DNA recombinase|uniref:recombinase family protein n=1 Tax=Desulfobacter postgatei TaxID=2293 RepID=UPI002A35A8A8|nr:recombinase family protein [Desulfobacter postgatei]MDX9963626.1 recombinase family protein [Desulfobacter postgatei]
MKAENKTIAYLRVSTDGQDLKNQKLEILEYAQQHAYTVNDWVEVKVSSRKSTKERLVDQLLAQLKTGDCLIVSELSRLGRSVSQIITIVDELIQKQIKVIIIKQGMVINGQNDIQTKTMVTLFSLFAEIERDLISERTKNGLNRAKAEGKLIGRPTGNGKSKLDNKQNYIQDMLQKGVSRNSIAKMLDVSWPTLDHFIKTRGLSL